MQSLTLTCGEVATALGYRRRDGSPNRVIIRRLARDGMDPTKPTQFPPPIDPSLTVGWWRWSRAEIEAYAAGQWTPTKAVAS